MDILVTRRLTLRPPLDVDAEAITAGLQALATGLGALRAVVLTHFGGGWERWEVRPEAGPEFHRLQPRSEVVEAISATDPVAAEDREATLRLATAVLMIDVARADHVFDETEFDHAALNARLEGWVYKLPVYTRTNLTKRMEGLLKPLPEPEPEEPETAPADETPIDIDSLGGPPPGGDDGSDD